LDPCASRRASHVAPRKRIGVVDYVTLNSEDAASELDAVQCGIPGFDRPGTELFGEGLESTDPLLRFEVRGKRHARPKTGRRAQRIGTKDSRRTPAVRFIVRGSRSAMTEPGEES
jgi:hypothetical protein